MASASHGVNTDDGREIRPFPTHLHLESSIDESRKENRNGIATVRLLTHPRLCMPTAPLLLRKDRRYGFCSPLLLSFFQLTSSALDSCCESENGIETEEGNGIEVFEFARTVCDSTHRVCSNLHLTNALM